MSALLIIALAWAGCFLAALALLLHASYQDTPTDEYLQWVNSLPLRDQENGDAFSKVDGHRVTDGEPDDA